MADFETKLQRLSERGTPVGAEELIERIEAQLAGDPLVVVSKQREGVLMTKTDQPVPTKGGPGRGIAWALAAFAAVVTLGGLYLAFNGDDGQVVDQTTAPTATTVLEPEPVTMTDVEIVEAGVAAVYSGDAETAAALFELAPATDPSEYSTDEEVAEEAAYQEGIDGRLSLECTEPTESGDPFTCVTDYRNALGDAIGSGGGGDTFQVMVRDGQIVRFGFTVHSAILRSMGSFLSQEGRFDGYEECVTAAPFPASCAAIQMENVDAWANWYQTRDDMAVLQDTIASWFGGDCVAAMVLSVGDPNSCSGTSDPVVDMVSYESILEAQVSLENCEPASEEFVRCDVHYSNSLNDAVGKDPAVMTRTFLVNGTATVPFWFENQYPQDTELRESFQAFAESGELSAEYEAADCAISFTPDCANLIVDNLDDWAAWHLANN